MSFKRDLMSMRFLLFFVIFTLAIFRITYAQKSSIYTHELYDYNHAISLYQNKDYVAAQKVFERIKNSFDGASELKARSYYYEAFCAIRLNQKDADDLMNDFFVRFPTSTKRNKAFLEVGEYYFNNRSYAYALKWFSKVSESGLTHYSQEEFNFKKGYALFAVGSRANAKKYFSKLLNSPKYGAQANYYYGYMAYQEDDYDEAGKYLNQVANDKSFDDDIPYYMVNIRFKTGKFQEAIDTALPLYKTSNGIQKSELAKIIGESYFNLNQFEKAIPFLLAYEGKKGKWNNTDFYLLGYAYYKQKNYEDAMVWFSKIVDGNSAVSQNAYYHLAECYLKNDKKQEALNAFRNAKQMNFDEAIKKDAWLNYAKLSYEIGNPYKSVADVIQEYISAYPDGVDQEEIKEYLISAYISANDFQGALDYLKNGNSKDQETYYKVAYLYAVQLFEQEKFVEALHYFDRCQEGTSDLSYKAKALFWKAESAYQLKDYSQALENFENFRNVPGAEKLSEHKIVLYHLAYTYFQLKDYSQAGGHFNEFLNSPHKTELSNDSHLRLGDCFFALSNYYKAIPYYDKVVEANESDIDYAQLQIAFCYGYMGENDKKIKSLNEFIQIQLKSPLRDDAFYELGNTYVKLNKIPQALKAYDNVIKHYKMSSLVSKALLKQGLVYFNTDRSELALDKYKQVVNTYPGSDEAKEAIANAKQIYVEQGRVEEYERMVQNLDFIDVSDEEIEKTMFDSAEQFYLTNNLEKSIQSFEKYIARFPNGPNSLAANYYLADAYHRSGQTEKAIPYYQKILEIDNNQFTEKSQVKVATYYMDHENWEKAIDVLSKLEIQAESNRNSLFAQSNLMKGNYALQNYEQAVAYAEKVMNQDKLDEKIKSDAQIIIARSAFQSGDFRKAQEAFSIVESSAKGELKAEAIYYDAFFKHEEGNYKLSNVAVQKLASDFSSFKYWGGKGLVIMAKNFYALEDAYQATYILESVIQKFADFKDVVDEAKSELARIKTQEAKTNSSVILDNDK